MSRVVHINGAAVELESLVRAGQDVRFTIAGKDYAFRAAKRPDGTVLLEREVAPGVWTRAVVQVARAGKDATRVQVGALEALVSGTKSITGGSAGAAELSPRAPMPGLVRQVMVAVGDTVSAGQPLAVMEAMKLQLTLSAGADATVEAVLVKAGDMIAEGTELVKLAAKA